MGLLDDLTGSLTGGAAGSGGAQSLVTSIVELLGSQQGGLSGLVGAFQQKGLGDIVSSWIGTGANLPITAEQVQMGLGQESIQAFAGKLGISPESAGSQLAELLPGIVDKLTPGGQVPASGDLMSTGMGLLKDFLQGGQS